MRQPGAVPQCIQICQFDKVVRGQDQGFQIRDRVYERRLDAINPITRQEQGMQSRGQREVGKGADIVVCEIDGILVL